MVKKKGCLIKVEDKDLDLLYSNPAKFWKGISVIENAAFKSCSNLTSIEIPNTVNEINEFAFANCKNLTSVKISSSVSSIKQNAFENCTSLTTVKIGEDVLEIGSGAFKNCYNLTDVELSCSLAQIATDAFEGCKNVIYSFDILFYFLEDFKENIQSVKITDGIKSVKSGMFEDFKSLTSVKIPNSVEIIESNAFSGCNRLTSVEIPEGVKKIKMFAFSECNSLTDIKLPSTLETLEEGVFYGSGLTNIEIPYGIKHIGTYAFRGCKKLTNVTIPGSVKTIAEHTFDYCGNLTDVKLAEGVKEIKTNAFANTGLTTVEIPSSVEKIESGAFNSCANLTKVKIAEGVKEIDGDVFLDCTNLTDVEIPSTVQIINKDLFLNCENLTDVKIADGVKVIADGVFRNCKNLTKIDLPNSIEKIGYYAFANCNSLKNITIPKNITEIHPNTFLNCKNLTDVTIPDTVNFISKSAFDNCTNLNYLYFTSDEKNYSIPAPLFTLLLQINQNTQYILNYVDTKQFKKYNTLFKKLNTEQYNKANFQELVKLGSILGLFEKDNVTINIGGKDVKASDLAYDIMQRMLLTNKSVDFAELHINLQSLPFDDFNPALLKFLTNKNNLSDLTNDIKFLPQLNAWFKERSKLNFDRQNSNVLSDDNNNMFPTTEENRYKIYHYALCEDGHYKNKWSAPTMALIKEEVTNQVYTNVNKDNKLIAEHLSQHAEYKEQKFFDKAVEISQEFDQKQKAGEISEHILSTHLKEDILDSLENYKQQTEKMQNNILENSAQTINNQAQAARDIFTYEMLPKNSVENFSIGLMTSCCATLFGAGAGAQKATMLHPDLQSLVIRDKKDNIVAFGILYINRAKGYGVVNDIEVNTKFRTNDNARKQIYNKLMQGISTFAEYYNSENPTMPLTQINCGLSPNWLAINDYIKQNPKSEILQAVNFDEYKYAGNGYWPGDWQNEQRMIWKNNTKPMDVITPKQKTNFFEEKEI